MEITDEDDVHYCSHSEGLSCEEQETVPVDNAGEILLQLRVHSDLEQTHENNSANFDPAAHWDSKLVKEISSEEDIKLLAPSRRVEEVHLL